MCTRICAIVRLGMLCASAAICYLDIIVLVSYVLLECVHICAFIKFFIIYAFVILIKIAYVQLPYFYYSYMHCRI